jgi:hypothetical protein
MTPFSSSSGERGGRAGRAWEGAVAKGPSEGCGAPSGAVTACNPSIASPVGKPQTEQWRAVDAMGCSQMGQLEGTVES